MPEDYREVVFRIYKKRKAEMDLSPNLLDPTPGNLRAECLIVHREKYTPKDHEVLRLFFNDGDKETGYMKCIENSSAAKFKQMSKVLKGADVKKPGLKYFELLEWLMDLKLGTSTLYYRSFYDKSQSSKETNTEGVAAFGQNNDGINISDPNLIIADNQGNDSEKDHIGKIEDKISNPLKEQRDEASDKPIVPAVGVLHNSTRIQEIKPVQIEPNGSVRKDDHVDTKPRIENRLSIKMIITITISIVFVTLSAFLFWQDQKDRATITKDEKCMYWNGDTYEAVACNLETSSVKIPLDTAVLHQLKKINEPDTLTQHSIDKVWYGKVNGKPEFYTAAGNHPLVANKRLMPLTDYMLKKYVSYHRYQLKILIWSIGGVLLIVILAFITFVRNKK